jgi:hypothetical protein
MVNLECRLIIFLEIQVELHLHIVPYLSITRNHQEVLVLFRIAILLQGSPGRPESVTRE